MFRQSIAVASLAPILMACVAVTGDPKTLAEFRELADELDLRLDGLSETPGSSLPATGSARYDGILRMTMPDGSFGAYSVMGNLDLDVAFAAGAVSGAADGFIEESGQRFPGRLSIRDGVVTRGTSESGFVGARMTGSLNDGSQDIGINRILSGSFFGPGGQMVGGAVRDAGAVQLFGGFFIAER